jgi:ribosomal protein L23
MDEGKQILLGFWVSEKANFLSSSASQYVFHVANDATKAAVRRAIRREFGIVPIGVNVLNRTGKNKRVRISKHHSASCRQAAIKKAFVTLRAGDKIETI